MVLASVLTILTPSLVQQTLWGDSDCLFLGVLLSDAEH